MWKNYAVALAITLAVCGWLSTATGDDPLAQLDIPVQPNDGREPAADPNPGGANPGNVGPAAPEPVADVPPFMGQIPGVGQDNEIPRRVAREFAPWIAALVQEKWNNAAAIYPIRREAQEYLDLPNARRILRKFGKPNGLDLALVGGRGLGDQAGVLLFTVTTESGPVAFKIYHYRFGNTRSVGKIEITDDWADLEKLYLTVDPLHSPVLVPM